VKTTTTLATACVIGTMLLCACGDVPPTTRSAAEHASVEPTAAPASTMDPLVTTEWLQNHLEDPGLVILDCSVRVDMDDAGGFEMASGRQDYEAGHIPGAGFADLLGELSDGDSPLQFALPSAEAFAASMAALGVGDNSTVVLYDMNNSGWAARVWWMLRWIGFDNAAILDGGFAAWSAEDRPVSTDLPTRDQAPHLTAAVRPEVMADKDDVLAAIEDPSVTLIDVLPEAHYQGQMAMYARPGHIATAVNIPTMALMAEDGRYKPMEELQQLFAGDHGEAAITYCGGGIAAASTAFTMYRLGFTDVALYDASLQEWTADDTLPMERAEP
jgi:thiosulfate/3-mercaptopyruvate sulfurtransferase